MEADNDIQLMLRFREGDEQAFRTLYVRYRKKIINFCYRFFPYSEVAEELAQEVFIRVYKSGPRYRPDARFSTWIFKIATNICLNEQRKSRYNCKTLALDEEIETASGTVFKELESDVNDQPFESVVSSEKERVVQQALGKLKPKQKAAMILLIYEGFSYQEISLQLKCSVGSVKSLVHRGREHLKRLLKNYFKE